MKILTRQATEGGGNGKGAWSRRVSTLAFAVTVVFNVFASYRGFVYLALY